MPDAPSPLWTAAEIAAADGRPPARRRASRPRASPINSREIEPGDLFVALEGARDGHEFVASAFAAGAAGALVERPVDGGPASSVADTLKALEALGVAARDRAPQVRRGAVTGSVGKTSVTQAIKAGLDLAGPAHASVKSYNNHIGVPLTLARMPADAERAVFEIGMNHAGRDRARCRAWSSPHAACVTTVGPGPHRELPRRRERAWRGQRPTIFEGLGPGGVAVLNADNDWFAAAAQGRPAGRGARVVSFGVRPTAATPG